MIKTILLTLLKSDIAQIKSRAIQEKELEDKANRLDMKRIENEVVYPIGSKLIARSNEEEPLLIGVVIAHERVHDNWFIWIRDEKTHERFLVGNQIIKPYREDLLVALNKLTYKEQWNVMAQSYFF